VTLALETGLKPADLRARADFVHAAGDLAAPISSGSFQTIGMIVAPCSVRSMAEIATGATTTLLTRAADVTLKERRRLVLMVRETPLHTGHLRTMTALSEIGAVIAPTVPAFYAKPQSLEEMIDQTLGRILDLFELDAAAEGQFPRIWTTTLIASSMRSRAYLIAVGTSASGKV
jgi:4-hydroxy-3-polyprenylbenzoate decarboxylase